MSYDIEYARAVFYLPQDISNYHSQATEAYRRSSCDHYVFHKIGCNNVHPRPKNWALMAYGWPYSVVAKVCEIAGHTEGGGLKLNDKDTTPENYLKLYRSAMAKAEVLTVESVKEKVGAYKFEIFVDPKRAMLAKEHDNFRWKQLVDLTREGEGCSPWTRGEDQFDMKVWTRPFDTVEDLTMFAHGQGLARALGGFGEIDSFNNE